MGFPLPFAAPLPADPASAADVAAAVRFGRDLTIDRTTGDLVLTAGDLTLVLDVAAIAQEVNIRLRFLLGEWFLDTTAGVPYLQTVLVKTPNLAAVRTVLRDEILECAGVKSLTRLDLDFEKSTRELTVTWSATTDLGELIPAQEVTL